MYDARLSLKLKVFFFMSQITLVPMVKIFDMIPKKFRDPMTVNHAKRKINYRNIH